MQDDVCLDQWTPILLQLTPLTIKCDLLSTKIPMILSISSLFCFQLVYFSCSFLRCSLYGLVVVDSSSSLSKALLVFAPPFYRSMFLQILHVSVSLDNPFVFVFVFHPFYIATSFLQQ